MSSRYLIEALSASHERSRFASGSEPLDIYFQTRVTQDIRRRLTACFVASVEHSSEIAGFYTLAPASIALTDLEEGIRSRLPRYPNVPAIRLGRLAVNRTHQGKGLGGILLADALSRCIRSEITAFATVVDAKDATAAAFYRHHGFMPFLSKPNSLYMPLAEAARRRSNA